MMMDEFEVRSYGWQELAVLYGPDLMPASAGKRLSQWVGVNPELKTELQGNGWRKGKKMLTPLQVRTIVQYLGEPLKQGTSVCEIRDFDVSNHEVREVKDRTSGCERRDFFSFLSCLCRFKGVQGNELIYILIYLF